MAAHDLDALVVSGNEYSGFEGAVTYMSGFQIVHRYAYVVVPADVTRTSSSRPRPATSASTGRPSSSRSSTIARRAHRLAREGRGLAARRRVRLDYVMAVRDYGALDGLELVRSTSSSTSRAVKSEAELESVRDSVRINERGFEIFFEAYAPGKTAARSWPPRRSGSSPRAAGA